MNLQYLFKLSTSSFLQRITLSSCYIFCISNFLACASYNYSEGVYKESKKKAGENFEGQSRSESINNHNLQEEITTPLKGRVNGWEYIAEKLRRDGISENVLIRVYGDPRMPHYGFVPFKLKPKETKSMYSGFRSRNIVNQCRKYLSEYEDQFARAERFFKVSRNVVCSIILVESRFGENTGNDLVINRLSRVASVKAPKNLQENFLKAQNEYTDVTFEAVSERASYLENTFYPEVRSLFRMVTEDDINPFTLRGSSAGAFGLPQFLPSAYYRYGFDGNKDGRTDLFNVDDAIPSVAKYLRMNGWNDKDLKAKRDALWKYNKSVPYADTVLTLSEELGGTNQNSSLAYSAS
jgi:membrane-bound lytic murein transglycosylase B